MRTNKILLPKIPDLLFLALLLVLALTSAVVPAQVREASVPTIKNFGKVNDSYYRGSQPDAEALEHLKQLGVKTIIDLRRDHKPNARESALKSGLQYFNIPLKANQPATDEQTAHFLKLVNDPANWPVYVHCKGGRHRTGALTAAYRITHYGWTAEQAFREMKVYDFDNGLWGGPAAQKKFVFSFYEQHRARQ